MKKAPVPKNESARLDAVQRLGILDTAPDPRFDSITNKVLARFKVPISTISIIDKDREWYKSCQGLGGFTEGSREMSFCGHALFAEVLMIVEDTKNDVRFADNPSVVGPPFVRFYAGAVLREQQSKEPVGVLCMKDVKPRSLTADEVSDFLTYAREAEGVLNEVAIKKNN